MSQQACPVLDTGRDEGNAIDGRFSAACQKFIPGIEPIGKRRRKRIDGFSGAVYIFMDDGNAS
jgi:hypothetical protein